MYIVFRWRNAVLLVLEPPSRTCKADHRWKATIRGCGTLSSDEQCLGAILEEVLSTICQHNQHIRVKALSRSER
jgi:hypothetical protein